MLIPRFSVRTMLVGTTLCAVLASMISWGLAGSAWAAGVASAALGVVFAFLLYFLFFAIAFLFSRAFRKLTQPPSRTTEGRDSG